MGLDGGTLITRNDVLRRQSALVNSEDNSRSSRGGAVQGVYKRRRLAPEAERRVRWSTCSLSGEPLAAPIVADYLGALYNRAAVLEFLLARKGNFEAAASGSSGSCRTGDAEQAALYRHLNRLRELGEALEHLTSMRDVFAVRLQPDSGSGSGGSGSAEDATPHRCPVTHLSCLAVAFSALVTCGHVISDRALKEVRVASGSSGGGGGSVACPVCAQAAAAEDVIPIAGTEEQVAVLREALPGRKKQQKRNGKQKAGSKGVGGGGAGGTAGGAAGAKDPGP